MSTVQGEAASAQPDASTKVPPVDDASLTDNKHRRDSLEKHLHTRPTVDELKQKHILLDTNAAPSLQAAQHDLEKQRITDSLKKGLEHRPEREDLEQRESYHWERYEASRNIVLL